MSNSSLVIGMLSKTLFSTTARTQTILAYIMNTVQVFCVLLLITKLEIHTKVSMTLEEQ